MPSPTQSCDTDKVQIHTKDASGKSTGSGSSNWYGTGLVLSGWSMRSAMNSPSVVAAPPAAPLISQLEREIAQLEASERVNLEARARELAALRARLVALESAALLIMPSLAEMTRHRQTDSGPSRGAKWYIITIGPAIR